MSHTCGRVVGVGTRIGPDSGAPPSSAGVWEFLLTPSPAVLGGTARFVMLHFDTMSFPGSSRLEVDLRYGIDTFNAASSADGWTRPIDPLPWPHPDPLLRRRTERRRDARRVRERRADADRDARRPLRQPHERRPLPAHESLHRADLRVAAQVRRRLRLAEHRLRHGRLDRGAARPGRSAASSAFTVTAPAKVVSTCSGDADRQQPRPHRRPLRDRDGRPRSALGLRLSSATRRRVPAHVRAGTRRESSR